MNTSLAILDTAINRSHSLSISVSLCAHQQNRPVETGVILGSRSKIIIAPLLFPLNITTRSLCVIMVEFYNGSSSTDLAIDVPDFLDLSRMRATGLQAGEEELPDLMPPIVLPEDTRGTDTILCLDREGGNFHLCVCDRCVTPLWYFSTKQRTMLTCCVPLIWVFLN